MSQIICALTSNSHEAIRPTGSTGLPMPLGKGGRIRTVAIPVWVKQAINAWMTAAGIEDGRLVRSISKGGKVGKSQGAWSAWPVVEQSAKEIGIAPLWSPRPAPGRAPSSAGRTAATWNRSNSSWGTP
jgi:hypothetical protein